MDIGLQGSFGIAALLGLRHGLDADHLAAIDAISRLHVAAGRLRLARLSGLLFALGHGAVVLSAALWFDGAAAQLPGWLNAAGTGLSLAMLGALGLANLRQAIGAGSPRPASAWPGLLLRAPLSGHPAGALLMGALFACSFDTLTLAAWLGSAAWAASSPGSVLVPAALFVVGMAACDALNGVWVSHLVHRSASFAARSRRLFAALVACSALAMAGLGALRLASASFAARLDGYAGWLSALLVAALLLGFAGARRMSQRAEAPANRAVSDRRQLSL